MTASLPSGNQTGQPFIINTYYRQHPEITK